MIPLGPVTGVKGGVFGSFVVGGADSRIAGWVAGVAAEAATGVAAGAWVGDATASNTTATRAATAV